MKRLTSVLATISLCAVAMLAQQSTTSTPQSTSQGHGANDTQSASHMGNSGQSWYGILVDSKCSGAGMGMGSGSSSKSGGNTMPRSTAGEQSKMNRTTPSGPERTYNSTDRNTSGTADRGTGSTATSGDDMHRTTGSAGSGRGADTQNGNNSARSGSSDRSMDNRSMDNKGNWNQTGEVASSSNMGSWDRSCFITPSSTSFMLHTQDGRMLPLDDAANSRIVSQLQSTQRVQNAGKIFRVRIKGSMSGESISLTDIQM